MSHQESTQAIAEIKEEVQLAEWQKQIEARQSSGLHVSAWCEQQGISKTTYYYRLRRVREHLCQKIGVFPKPVLGEDQGENPGEPPEEAVAGNRIVPIRETVRIPAESRIEIVSGDLRISFEGETAPAALKAVIEVLRSC